MYRLFARLADAARRDTSVLVLANLNYALVGVITGVLAARALGPEGRGDLAVVVFWPTLIATIVDLGLGDALTLRIARDRRALGDAVVVALCVGALVSVIGGALAWGLLPLLLRDSQDSLIPLARLALLLVPANVVSAIPVAVLLGLRRFRSVAAVRVLSVLGYLAAVIAVVLSGRASPEAFMWLAVLSRVLPVPIAAALIVREWARSPRRSAAGWPTQAAEGVRLHATRLATVLSASEDRVVANWTLSQIGIGHWHVAATLNFLMPFVSQGISQELFSRVSQVAPPARADLVARAYARSVMLTGVLSGVALPVLPVLIPLVFGREFNAAVLPAMVIVGTAFVGAGIGVLEAGARASGSNRICVEAELAGIVAMASFAWPLVNTAGLTGLALSHIGGRLACLVWLVARGGAELGWNVWELVPLRREFGRRLKGEWRVMVTGATAQGPQ